MVGAGQSPEIGVDGLPATGRGRSGSGGSWAGSWPFIAARCVEPVDVCEAMSTGMASIAFLVICSVPSMTAWIAALRISQSRLPIIPLVRWCR